MDFGCSSPWNLAVFSPWNLAVLACGLAVLARGIWLCYSVDFGILELQPLLYITVSCFLTCRWLCLFYYKLSRLLYIMKALKEITKFTGQEDVERWIDQFELAIRLDGKQSEEADLLAMRLDGVAYDMWKGLNAADQASAETVKAALRRVYGKSRMAAWASATSQALVPGEPVDAFVQKLYREVDTAIKGSDPARNVCALLLMIALPSEVCSRVAMHVGRDLDLSSIINAAQAILDEVPSRSAAAMVANVMPTFVPETPREAYFCVRNC